MPRPGTQARAARKLRREWAWIATDPDAAALAQQLVYLAAQMDTAEGSPELFAAVAHEYLATRAELRALAPEAE